MMMIMTLITIPYVLCDFVGGDVLCDYDLVGAEQLPDQDQNLSQKHQPPV